MPRRQRSIVRAALAAVALAAVECQLFLDTTEKDAPDASSVTEAGLSDAMSTDAVPADGASEVVTDAGADVGDGSAFDAGECLGSLRQWPFTFESSAVDDGWTTKILGGDASVEKVPQGTNNSAAEFFAPALPAQQVARLRLLVPNIGDTKRLAWTRLRGTVNVVASDVTRHVVLLQMRALNVDGGGAVWSQSLLRLEPETKRMHTCIASNYQVDAGNNCSEGAEGINAFSYGAVTPIELFIRRPGDGGPDEVSHSFGGGNVASIATSAFARADEETAVAVSFDVGLVVNGDASVPTRLTFDDVDIEWCTRP